MGRPIVYCAECGRSLRDEDFAKGRASMRENQPLCSQCHPVAALPSPLPSAEPSASSPQLRTLHRSRSTTDSLTPVLIGAGVVVGAIAVMVLLSGGSREDPRPAPASVSRLVRAPEPPAPAPPPAAPVVDRAAETMKELERFVSGSPEPDAILARCEKARRELAGTPYESRLRAIEESALQAKRPAPKANPLDTFLAEVRKVRDFDADYSRSAEVLSMFDKAIEIAGPQRADVERMRDEYVKARDAARKPAPPPAKPAPAPVFAVAIASPAPASVFLCPAEVPVAVNAIEPRGRIVSVELYTGPALIGTSSAPPYLFTATFPHAGVYDLTARATNDQGATVTSAPLRVTVAAPGTVYTFQDGVSPNAQYRGTADTYLSEPAPTKAFGTAATVKIDGAVNTAKGDDEVALLRWDLKSLPPRSQVESATLTIWVTNPTGWNFFIHEMKRPWDEREATWLQSAANKPWELAGVRGETDRGAAKLAAFKANAQGAFAIPLQGSAIAMIQSWIDNPAANYGLILANTDNGDGLGFDSREGAVPEQHPKLTIVISAPPGKLVYAEDFRSGCGRFTGGQCVTGGVDTSKALCVPPKGVVVKGAFSAIIRPSTLVRLKLKPLADVDEVAFVTWSGRQKENAWFWIRGLRKGEWNEVVVRLGQLRIGPKMDGAKLDGEPFDNFTLYFERQPADARVLLDDVEVHE